MTEKVDWVERIRTWMDAHREALLAMYEDLHACAEISWQEKQTTDYLAAQLEALQLQAERFDGHTGVLARWSARPDTSDVVTTPYPQVVLRADIDALWQEKDGRMQANHSCGHDGHSTMAYYALRCLREIGYMPPDGGELLALFQPAEELAEGALRVLASGKLDEATCMLGIHLRPRKELPLGQASAAIYHGGVAVLGGEIRGRQAHAARPEDGINALESFAAAALAIRAVNEASAGAGSCKVTTIEAPNASSNLIPDYVAFQVDVRATSVAQLERLITQVEAAVSDIGKQDGAETSVTLLNRSVPAIADPQMEQVVGNAIAQWLGPAGLAAPVRTPGAEDFHFYPTALPRLHATMIGLGCGLTPGLHHPGMTFSREALVDGAAMLALGAIGLFAHFQENPDRRVASSGESNGLSDKEEHDNQ